MVYGGVVKYEVLSEAVLARCSSEPCQAGGGRVSPASLIGCCELVVDTRSERRAAASG
jgi:hypothetical protein